MKWIEAIQQLPEGSKVLHTPSGEIWELKEYCKNFDNTQRVLLLQRTGPHMYSKMWVSWKEINSLENK